MALIQIKNLTFAYEGSYDNVFENVDFQIDSDWKLGFIGRNGRGKTTFLKLLMGEFPYQGNIITSTKFEYFPYFVKDNPSLAISILEEINPDFEYWEIAKEMNLLEIEEDVLYRPFHTLSGGEQTKLLLAVLFLKNDRFLLIDEPTNHLDIKGRELLKNYINRKKSFILVSHDRAFLDGCVDHILSINKTNIEVQTGNYSSWKANKERQDSYELAENDRMKKEIGRLKKTAREKAEWSNRAESRKFGTANSGMNAGPGFVDRGFFGHKAEKMMRRAKALEERTEKAIEEKSKLLKNIESSDDLKISALNYHKSHFISMQNVAITYDNHIVCQDISFIVERGDRIALCGKNGCEKSSILKLICGESIEYTGNIEIGSGLKISYISQNTSFLKGRLSDFAQDSKIDESLFKAILRKMDFSRIQFEKDIADFSEGQKKKVLIAKSLCESAHLYIWDEPLNFVDMNSRIQIENLLLDFQPTMIFVEHDQAFRDAVATKLVEFDK